MRAVDVSAGVVEIQKEVMGFGTQPKFGTDEQEEEFTLSQTRFFIPHILQFLMGQK